MSDALRRSSQASLTTSGDCMKLFSFLRHQYLTVSTHTFHRETKVFDYCPHCDEKTPWLARVLTGYFRCLQCGGNPLEPADAPSSAATSSDRDAVRRPAAQVPKRMTA